MTREGGAAWATNAGLLIFGLLMIMLARAGVVEFHHYIHGLGEDVFGQIILYLGAIALVERCRVNRWTLGIILGVALAVRLVCVFAPPFLSTDVYRYVWDGEVQAAGINPYRYIPAAPELAPLRDDRIYPNINRKEYAHTIYPPAAQAIFFGVTRLSASETFMKLAMVGFEAVTCLVLLRMLDLLGLPRERIVLYAWHPICFWEIASSGHVDAAALTCITLALYARLRQKPGSVGAWLGAAVLVKLYPAALLPALLERRAKLVVGVLAGVVLAGYACYASVGAGVFGFLSGYAQEEGINSGSRYFLLTLANRTLHLAVPPALYLGLCGAVLLGLSWWAYRRGGSDFLFPALVLATAVNLCFSPHYPWYFLWLLPMLTLVPWRPAFYLVTAVTFMLSTRLGVPGEPIYQMNCLLYGGFAVLLLYGRIESRLQAGFGALLGRSSLMRRKPPAERLEPAR